MPPAAGVCLLGTGRLIPSRLSFRAVWRGSNVGQELRVDRKKLYSLLLEQFKQCALKFLFTFQALIYLSLSLGTGQVNDVCVLLLT